MESSAMQWEDPSSVCDIFCLVGDCCICSQIHRPADDLSRFQAICL